jgi:ABC-2 type transport system permease protein/oleandomycin transport system permease protein
MRVLSDWRYMTHRNLIRLVRNPEKLLMNVVMTVMFVLLFRYVFGGAIATPNGSYVNFLVPGIIVQSAVFISASTSMALAEDLSTGIIDRFRAMPIARSAVLAGRLLSDTVENTIIVVCTMAVGFAVGWRIDTSPLHLLALLGLTLLIGLAVASIGAYIGITLKKPAIVQSFGMIWMFPATFVSGVFIPVETMPGWLEAVAAANPVTIWSEVLRDLTIGDGSPEVSDLLASFAWIAGLVVAFGLLAVRAYRRIE